MGERLAEMEVSKVWDIHTQPTSRAVTFSWQLVQIRSKTSRDTDYEDQRELIKILAPTFC